MVDNKTETANADSDKPAKSWEDMLVPPASGGEPAAGGEPESDAAATAADDAAKSPLDEMLLPDKTTDPDQPANLNEALDEIAGQPVPAAVAPRLDPTKVEEFKATARRLMQQDGVPADQIEQRLNDMVANAQQPLVPYTPPAPEAAPGPGIDSGFADRWGDKEQGIKNLLGVGGPGQPGVLESWKNLNDELTSTLLNPGGVVVDEVNRALDSPNAAYYFGGLLADGAAAAPGVLLGPETVLARGALDDVASGAIPRDVIDTPAATHNPAPLPTLDHPAGPPPAVLDPPSADHSPPTGHLPAQGDPGSFGYDADGNRLPYANGRPDYGPMQKVDTWNITHDEQVARIDNGILDLPPPQQGELWVRVTDDYEGPSVRVTETGERYELIEWAPGDPTKGVWDMGHVPFQEYRHLREQYLSGQISFDEFMTEYRDPNNYRVQDPSRNRSRIDEGP